MRNYQALTSLSAGAVEEAEGEVEGEVAAPDRRDNRPVVAVNHY